MQQKEALMRRQQQELVAERQRSSIVVNASRAEHQYLAALGREDAARLRPSRRALHRTRGTRSP
eukprot:3981560-Alexandrium_andersonii.AAC.1